QILRQAEMALAGASHIIFLVDGRAEITGADRDLARMLQKLGKPVTLAVNKADTVARYDQANEVYELGIPDLVPVSAEHGRGVDAAPARPLPGRPKPPREGPAPAPDPAAEPIKVAIIGRPNVGKSTLLNALTGQERAIVSPVAGTTRDAVDEKVTRGG